MKNWKTTTAGTAALLGAVADVLTQISTGSLDGARLMADFSAIAAGVGLLVAKDMNVTGGDVRQ